MRGRVWAARVAGAAEELLAPVLGDRLRPYAPELAAYLPGSLGNAQRIDYGTGHETAFAALLFCLARAGAARFPLCRCCTTDSPASFMPGSAPVPRAGFPRHCAVNRGNGGTATVLLSGYQASPAWSS